MEGGISDKSYWLDLHLKIIDLAGVIWFHNVSHLMIAIVQQGCYAQ